jgi:serine phosphatase RsbU (regulator of sigma subunit)
MRILFLGIQVDASLKSALLANGVAVSAQPRPTPQALPGPPDIIAVAIKAHAPLKALQRLRKQFPLAWIAAVVPQKFLKSANFQNALLSCREKDDVWVSPGWQQTFWFALQRAIVHHKEVRELRTLRENMHSLQKNYRELSHSSDKLIAQLEKDVGLASNIQRTLLPSVSPEIPGVSVAVKYIPAAGLGGDYYDIFEFGDRRRFGVIMADSKTHGMAAVLLSALLKVRVDEVKDRFPDSCSFMEFINREIQGMKAKDLSSLSLLYGILDRGALTFDYTVAGNLRPLLWRNGTPQDLQISAAPPLGDLAQFDFRENRIQLHPGDLLLLHTDGLEGPLAQHGPSAFEKLVQILKTRKHSQDPLELQNELMALVDQYVDKKPLEDDLTLVHFTINERALYLAQAK